MAIPPYMLKKVAERYKSVGEARLVAEQRRSDLFTSTAITLIGSHSYTRGCSSLPNRQVRFIRPGEAKTIEAQICSLTPTGPGEFISSIKGDMIRICSSKKISEMALEEQNAFIKTLSIKRTLFEEVEEKGKVVGLNISFSEEK